MRAPLLAAVLLLSLSRSAIAQAPPYYVRGVRVSAPPPAYRSETPPPAPSPRHQWIPGYWGVSGGRHVWLAGHWAIPPGPSYIWEPARWITEGGAQVFYDGHWRSGEDPDASQVYQPPAPPVREVVVEAPPPAVPEEVHPSAPFAGAVWIPGFWQWSGSRQVWVAGRWSAQPPGFTWQRHHWDHRDDGKWVQRPGHWEHRDEGDDRHDEHRDDHRGERH